jgi:hypothetical protein
MHSHLLIFALLLALADAATPEGAPYEVSSGYLGSQIPWILTPPGLLRFRKDSHLENLLAVVQKSDDFMINRINKRGRLPMMLSNVDPPVIAVFLLFAGIFLVLFGVNYPLVSLSVMGFISLYDEISLVFWLLTYRYGLNPSSIPYKIVSFFDRSSIMRAVILGAVMYLLSKAFLLLCGFPRVALFLTGVDVFVVRMRDHVFEGSVAEVVIKAHVGVGLALLSALYFNPRSGSVLLICIFSYCGAGLFACTIEWMHAVAPALYTREVDLPEMCKYIFGYSILLLSLVARGKIDPIQRRMKG